MYNGIGLQTARGSGTNGYVVKNMSAFRPRDGPPNGGHFGTGANFGALDDLPRARQPDQGILDHERKRAVEVKCAELEDSLEEKGVPEDEILDQVSALRTRLLAQIPQARDVKTLKASDTHALAEAKERQLSRFQGAFGISAGYKEGAAFDRDEQERLRAIKRAEWEEKDRLKIERARELEKAEEDRREAMKVARREEERKRIALERAARDAPPPSRRRSPSPPPRGSDYGRRRSPSPYARRRRSFTPESADRGRSRSRSPVERRRARSPSTGSSVESRGRSISRSRSPPPRRRVADSRSYSRSLSRSRSPVARRRRDSSTPPAASRRRHDSDTPPRR